MTASFPTSNWSGVSRSRPNPSAQQRGPDGEDWRRLTLEVQAVEMLLDAIGVSTVGAFATSDPDKGKQLFADTLVLTLGGNTDPEDYPNKWDGTSDTRPDATVVRAPDGGDWKALVARIVALQKRVQPLGIPADAALPTSEPATGGYLWINTAVTRVVTVSDEAGSHTNTLWDGTSPTRPDGDVYRAPDWQDYDKARDLLLDMSKRLVPFGFDADGGMPTSDPSVSKEWYTSTNVVNSSA